MSLSPRPVAALVVVAMQEEAEPFLRSLAPRSAAPDVALPGRAQAWSLDLGGHELVLLRCGIGLVAAASALAGALAQVAPEVIVSAGTTGGLGRNVEVGDVCACTSTAYNDVDATAFGYALGQTPGQPPAFTADAGLVARVREVGQVALGAATATSGSSRVHVGQMLSGGSFVTAANVGATRELFPQAVSTDMETTALAQVAHACAVPFVSVRGVSDLCGPEAGQEFHISSDEAAARSAAVVLAVLR